MGIKNMLGRKVTEENTIDEPQTEHSNFYHEVKRKIHGRLVEEANLAALDTLEPSEIRSEIENVVEYYLREEKTLLNENERKNIIDEILDELMGLLKLIPPARISPSKKANAWIRCWDSGKGSMTLYTRPPGGRLPTITSTPWSSIP